MNGCVVAEKTLVCYKRDDKPCTNKQTILQSFLIRGMTRQRRSNKQDTYCLHSQRCASWHRQTFRVQWGINGQGQLRAFSTYPSPDKRSRLPSCSRLSRLRGPLIYSPTLPIRFVSSRRPTRNFTATITVTKMLTDSWTLKNRPVLA